MEKITVSKAQKAATAKYKKENYDKILVRFPKGIKEKINMVSAISNRQPGNLLFFCYDENMAQQLFIDFME